MSTSNLLDDLIRELETVQAKCEQLSEEVESIAKRAFILGYKQAQADAAASLSDEPTNKAWQQARIDLGIN